MSKQYWKAMAIVAFLSILIHRGPEASAQAHARKVVTVTDLSASLEDTARLVTPSVVEIFATSYVPGEGVVSGTTDLVWTQRASGSGVIVDSEGYILTNAHVVRGAHRLRVALPSAVTGRSILATNSRMAGARIVGVDQETDLAVIKVDAQNLPALAFGDSDELQAGQIVLAFGSPLGFHNSVSLGVISAVARQLDPESPMVYVQTDAAINPGSSGGPLVDLRGRLMGINTLIISQAGGSEGLGFAAPSNIVQTVYEQIRRTGRVRRGEIGVRTQTVTPVMAAGLNLGRDHGVIVADVAPDGPAARTGMRPGDLILSLDGKPVENGRQFQVSLYRHPAGEAVSLEILREGRTMKVPVVVTDRQERLTGLPAPADPRENLVPRLGILGLNLDRRIAEMVPVVRVRSGVVVASTVEGAIEAAAGGLEAGDVIYAVNRTVVSGLADLRAVLDAAHSGDPIVLQLERRGELMYLAFEAE